MCDVCILGGRKDSYCVYEKLKCYCDRCTVDVKWLMKCDMKACPICLVIKFYTTIENFKGGVPSQLNPTTVYARSDVTSKLFLFWSWTGRWLIRLMDGICGYNTTKMRKLYVPIGKSYQMALTVTAGMGRMLDWAWMAFN